MKNFLLILCLLFVTGCTCCSTQNNNTPLKQIKVTKENVIESKPVVPDNIIAETPFLCRQSTWIYKTPQDSEDTSYFVGISENANTNEKKARDAAFFDSLKQFARYCGVEITTLMTLISQSRQINSHYNEDILINEKDAFYANAVAIHFKAKEWCVQQIKGPVVNGITQILWKAYVLSSVPKEKKQWVQDIVSKSPKPRSLRPVQPKPKPELIKPVQYKTYPIEKDPPVLISPEDQRQESFTPVNIRKHIKTNTSEEKNNKYSNDPIPANNHHYLEPEIPEQPSKKYPIHPDDFSKKTSSDSFNDKWR